MGFFRGFHCVTLRDKARSCDIRKALNVEPLFFRTEISATMIRSCDQSAPVKIGDASLADYTNGKSTQRFSKDQVA